MMNSRKCVFIYVLLYMLSISETVFAQRFDGGIIGGISASQIEGDGLADYDKLGFFVGAFVRTKFSETTGASSGIHYIGKGSKNDIDPLNGDLNNKRIHLDYIEVPFLFNFYIKDIAMLEAGVQGGVLLRSTMKIDGYTVPPETYNYNSFDFTGCLGAHYLMNDRLSFNIRLSYSVVSIIKSRAQYNNVVSAAIHYRL